MANGHGGKRAGAGLKKGTKLAPTLEREAAEQHYRSRWQTKFNDLLDAQYSTAVGVKQFVYRDDTGRFKVISDPDELQARVNLGQSIEIVTRLASPQAQSDVLDRILGKAKNQPIDVNVKASVNIVDTLRSRFAKRKKAE